MRFIQNIKEKIGRFLLSNEVEKHQRDRTSINYSAAANIGILYDATDSESAELVHKFASELRNEQKKVFELGYVDRADIPYDVKYNINSEFFWRKKLLWNGLPEKSGISRFLNEEFDILLNLYTSDTLPLHAVSVYSKAKFRIGHYSRKAHLPYYDLMIDTGNNYDLKHYIEQINHYIKTF